MAALAIESRETFTLKEYKANKAEFKKLAARFPIVYNQKYYAIYKHGFQLINEGITHYENEEIDPCKTYKIRQVSHEVVDQMENLKNIFMDKGLKGVHKYVELFPTYYAAQKLLFPHLYNS